MPVSAWISGGMGTPGLTSVLHSVTRGAATSAGIGLDPDDADLRDGVGRRRRAGGLEVDEGEGGREEAHDE